MKRRILSIIMALVMLMSMVCINTTIVYAGDQAEVNGTVYWSHQTAWKKAVDGGYTFKLLGNWTATDSDFSIGATSSEDDYFKNGAIYVPDGKSVTIDLNGHIIDRNLYSSRQRNGEIIYLGKNASLTIRDSAGGGYMEDGNSSNGAGGIHAKDGSRIYMYGGSIKWCKSSDGGGAVYLASGAKMYMYGGSIESCKAESAHGGAVYADTDSQFIMTGGTIKNCGATGSYYGGAVYAYHATCQFSGGTIANNTAQYGGGIYLNGKSGSNTTTVSGDILISGNTATKDGGGIYADRDSKISITGGRNTFNTAGNRGGGVFAEKYVAKCDITLGGTAHILYNTGSNTTSNLTLESGIKATLISFDSSDKARIGISSTSSDSDIILSDDTGSGAYSKYFISDKRDYAINRGYDDSGNYTDGKLHIIKGAEAATIVDIKYLRDENGNLIPVRDCDIDYGTNTVVLQLSEEQEIGNFYMKSGYNSDVASYEIVTRATAIDPEVTTVRDFSNSKNEPVAYKLTAFRNRTEQFYNVIITHDAIAGVAAVACNSAWTHYDSFEAAWNRVYTEMKVGNEVQMKLLWNWNAKDGSFGDGDGYKDGAIALIDTTTDTTEGKLTLDLNGCKIDRGMTEEGSNYNCVFYLENANVKIIDSSASKGGTITGAWSPTNFNVITFRKGGGIYANNAKLSLDGVTIKGNKAFAGGGIYASDSELNIKNSDICENTGYGMYLDCVNAYIENTKIYDNSEHGVCSCNSSSENWFLNINGCDIKNNQGGGVYSEVKTSIKNSHIYENNATGIGVKKGTPEISNCIIENNNGRGVYINNPGDGKIENCIIRNNKAVLGRAVYVSSERDDNLYINNCILTGNSAKEEGGAIYCTGSKDTDDNSSTSYYTTTVYLTDCSITENKANQGGGVYAEFFARIYMNGETYISKNTASEGGGMYIANNAINGLETVKLVLGGKLYIQDNKLTDGSISNLYLFDNLGSFTAWNYHYTIYGYDNYPLLYGSSIGISVEEGIINKIPGIAQNYYDYSKYYTSDDPNKRIVREGGIMKLSDGANNSKITAFELPYQTASSIDSTNNTINVDIPYGTDLTSLVPSKLEISSGATISPAADKACDFTSPVYYTVTNGNTAQVWTVNITKTGAPDAYAVTVNNGSITSSANEDGKYYVGSLVTVKADTIDGKTFKGWTAEGVTLSDAAMAENGFIMPENDVTLTAEYDTKVAVIDIAVDTPKAGEALPQKAAIKTSDGDEGEFDITWQPNDDVAKYGTEYTAKITIPAYDCYLYTENTKVMINGKVAEHSLNINRSITVYGTVAATAKLDYIMNPSMIYVPYNTDAANLPLPSSVGVEIETGDYLAADVTWNIERYSPTTSGDQEISGTVILPETVYTEDGFDLSTTIFVNVGEEGAVAVPTASPAPGYYTEKLTLELVAEDGAKIYYTTDGTKPTTSSTEYTGYISLNGENGQTIVTPIKAMAVKDGVASEVAIFEYAISLNTFDVNVIGGTGSGAYKVGDTVTIKSEIRNGMVFDGWSSDDVEISADRTDAGQIVVTSFTMPEKDVTITANYLTKVSSISLRMPVPVLGEDIATSMSALSKGVVLSDFAVTPDNTKAKADTEYTASVKLAAADGYIFADDVKVYINGTTAELTDGSVSYTFTADSSAVAVDDIKAETTDGVSVQSYDGSVFAVVVDTEMFGGTSDTSLYINAVKVALKTNDGGYRSIGTLSEYNYTDDTQQYAVFPVTEMDNTAVTVRAMLEAKPSHDSEGASGYYISSEDYTVENTAAE